MSEALKVAIVGASGLGGEALVEVLEDRQFPVSELHALASDESLGHTVSFKGQTLPMQELSGFDFGRVDLVFFMASGAASREYAPKAAGANCFVIDNTNEFRHRDEVPLVVPEVNVEALEGVGRGRIVANPNCTTVQLMVALKPLYDAAGIDRIQVATYQSVSGAGRDAVEEMVQQSISLLGGRGPVKPRVLPRQIAFNCVPHIDDFEDNGYTLEEMKLVRETHKILEDPDIKISVTAVRVPVFYGHSTAVTIETGKKLTAAQARAVLKNAPGVTVLDDPRARKYPTAATELANRDTVYVGRIREDLASDRGLNLWTVADNIRKGAATNCVQIAEVLAKRPI